MKMLLALSVIVLSLCATSTASAGHYTSPNYVYRGLLCIHHSEGAWNDNTGNGFYGGIQMNWKFMQTYGAEFLKMWGTADHWPPWAQLAAGARAFASRGWWPWPNTARTCGLI